MIVIAAIFLTQSPTAGPLSFNQSASAPSTVEPHRNAESLQLAGHMLGSVTMTNLSNDRSEFLSHENAADGIRSLNQVYLIDEDKAVLEMEQLVLRQAGYDVRAFEFSTDFVEQSADLPPGIVVTDQIMSPIDGIEALRSLTARLSQFRIIVVLSTGNVQLAVAAMKLGAVTVLEKPFKGAQLIQAVEEGFQAFGKVVRAGYARSVATPENVNFLSRLSPREREVIQLVYEGATNKAMSIQLKISIKTIEKHRSNAMKKIGVSSLAGLIRLMERHFGEESRGSQSEK